jgi:DNA-directed RNA polymerase specialized sigma24 family protein
LEARATCDDISTHERDMLVRYCARFTGNALVAEDLAQQTLLEA